MPEHETGPVPPHRRPGPRVDRPLSRARRLHGARARGQGARALRPDRRASRTRACAAAAAPASRWARRAPSCRAARWRKYVCCNADESEPGAFKDRELMMKNPHQLIEGVAIAALAVGAQHAFIFIRGEYWEIADVLDRAVAEAYEANYLGPNVLDTRDPGRARRPPRRRRLHLRRGDGAARRARGQARQPAAEAAVPGDPGPLRRADADQQRRDALQPAAHRQQRLQLVQGVRHRAVAGDEGGLGLRLRAAARQLRGRARDPVARASSSTSPAARPRAAG